MHDSKQHTTQIDGANDEVKKKIQKKLKLMNHFTIAKT